MAVIDSGVDLDHKDLEDNIWINPGESGGGKENNNVDDDNNGYIDDYRGWDFGENDNNPNDKAYNNYHGTHVAGIIAANGENGHGVLGVAPNVKLMVIKISNANGGITTSSITNAIQYSITNGANLSNNSYTVGSYDQTLYNVIAQAKNAGQLYVCAAGNDNSDIDTSPMYPACFNLDNIITVISSDHDNLRSSFSNYGENSADVAAPGGSGYPTYGSSEEEDIFSTQPNDEYGYKAGTSMATPYVVGVAALIWGKPYKIWWDQVKEIILTSVDSLESLDGLCVSEGRINAYQALYEEAPSNPPSNLSAYSTSWYDLHLSWQDNSNDELGFEIQAKRSIDESFYSRGAAKENTVTYYDAYEGEYSFNYRVRAYNLGGESSFSDIFTFTVPGGSPSAPYNLSTSFISSLTVKLVWYENANNEAEFIIERKEEGSQTWEVIDTVGQNTTQYTDTTVYADTFFWYRVKATNPNGSSSYSNTSRVYVQY